MAIRMEIRNISEALKPRKKVKYYIDKILRPSSVNMWYGEPGIGKSLTFISMGICLTCPDISDWLGFEKTFSQSLRFLYVQEEMGDEGFLEFLEEALKGYFGNVNIVEIPFDFVTMSGVKLDSENGYIELSKAILKGNYNVVVLDPFAAITNGDEDTKKDMQPVMDYIKMLAQLPSRPAIILPHHPTKVGLNYRGSGAIKGALDSLVSMKKKGKGSEEIVFEMEKNRYRPCIDWRATKKFEKNSQGEDVYKLERSGGFADEEEKEKVMVGLIENNPECSQDEIIRLYESSGGKKSHALGVLTKLDSSEITETYYKSTNHGRKKYRRLTEAYLAEQQMESVNTVIQLFKGHKKQKAEKS